MVRVKKKQFIYNYTGNKFVESENLETDFTKYTKIVECFGGSFGFSRYLYINDKVNPDVTFDIYDIDDELIEFFNYLKSLTIEEYNTFIVDYNKFCQVIIDSECNLQNKKKSMVSRLKMLDYVEKECQDTPKYIKYLTLHNSTTRHFTTVAIKDNLDEKYFEMLKKCSFHAGRYESIEYEKYDKTTTLFYLDPPFLLECNSFYKKLDKVSASAKPNPSGDLRLEIDKYYETMLMLFKEYNTYLTTSHNWFVDKVFGKWKIDTYEKLNRRVHVSYYSQVKPPPKKRIKKVKEDIVEKKKDCDISGCDVSGCDVISCEQVEIMNNVEKVKKVRKKKIVKSK